MQIWSMSLCLDIHLVQWSIVVDHLVFKERVHAICYNITITICIYCCSPIVDVIIFSIRFNMLCWHAEMSLGDSREWGKEKSSGMAVDCNSNGIITTAEVDGGWW